MLQTLAREFSCLVGFFVFFCPMLCIDSSLLDIKNPVVFLPGLEKNKLSNT